MMHGYRGKWQVEEPLRAVCLNCRAAARQFRHIGKVFTSKSVGTGPSSYEIRIDRAAVSQRLRDTGLDSWRFCGRKFGFLRHMNVIYVWLLNYFSKFSLLWTRIFHYPNY